jgi:octaprenyl-diphosphate synthase
VVANHFVDDEAQEFFGEFGVEIGVAGQLAQAGYLLFTHRLGHLESLCQHEHQRRIYIVDAFAILFQLFVHVPLPDSCPPQIFCRL